MYNNASSCVSCAGIKFGAGQDLYAFKSEGDFVTGFEVGPLQASCRL